MKDIFEYTHYIDFVRDLISNRPNKGRGEQTSLSKALNCQQAYLSKVLSKQADLNTDQGYALCRYFNLNSRDTDFFISLLLFNRAYTVEAKKYWKTKLDSFIREYQNLQTRLTERIEMAPENIALYYSDWIYAALHIMTGISEYQTINALSERLSLPPQVHDCLSSLVSMGLITKSKTDNRYTPNKKTLHLGNASPFIINHHRNWRLKALQFLNLGNENLHYSSVISCAKNDQPKIKEILIKAIENIRKLVKTSKEETIFVYGIDFFEL